MAEEEGFTVRDLRTGASEAGAGQQHVPRTDAQRSPDEGTPEASQKARSADDLDFSTFVISLATSAQVGLGVVPHPETHHAVQNFPAAKQMIDILALLKEKTKGNLTDDESTLLEQVLYNLRIHYVRALEGQKKSGG